MKNYHGRDKFRKYKRVINFITKVFSFFPKRVNIFIYNYLQSFPGVLGVVLRYSVLKQITLGIGNNVYIAKWVVIKNAENINIGNNVSLHEFCYIDGEGGLDIGNDVSIAHRVTILSSAHSFEDDSKPIKYNDMTYKKVVICDDVWIGANTIINLGVNIGNRVVVGANSFVNKKINSNVLAIGSPAKEIKKI